MDSGFVDLDQHVASTKMFASSFDCRIHLARLKSLKDDAVSCWDGCRKRHVSVRCR